MPRRRRTHGLGKLTAAARPRQRLAATLRPRSELAELGEDTRASSGHADSPVRLQRLLRRRVSTSSADVTQQLWTYETGAQAAGRAQAAADDRDRRLGHRCDPRPTSRDASSRRSTSSRSDQPNAPATVAVTARSSRASRRARPRATPAPHRTPSIVSLDVMDDRAGADERRDRGGASGSPEQGGVQHPRRELLAARGVPSHFCYDPLDQAVEKLWHAGVVVVAAAGNYGTDGARAACATLPAATRS